MKSFKILVWLVLLAAGASAQTIGLKVCETDGSPCKTGIREIYVSPGTLTITGQRATIAISGGGGSGDVVGPASSTDNAVARFDLATGKLLQNSVVLIGDTGAVTGVAALTISGVFTAGSGPTTVTDSAGKILSAALNTVQPAQGGTGITALGTGIATALGVNVGSAGAPVLFNGAGGTPSSLTLTNATGLPPTTGISGWPANASGVLTNNGSGTLSWAAAGGGITIGTTTITSGTTGRVLYDNAGVVGEMTTSGTGTQLALTAGPTFTGTVAGAAFTASSTITQTSASATAFESGPNGGTNPVFRLVNNTASSATGLSITGNAAAAGVTMTVLSSGSNESLNIQSKGTGRVNVSATTGLDGVLRVIGALSTANYFEIGTADSSTSYLTSSSGNYQLQGNSQFMMLGNRLIKFYNSGFNAAIGSDTSGLIEINSGTLGAWRDLKVRQHYVDQTITAGGTTGNQTINKSAGTVNIAAAGTSVTVTSSLCSTSSQVFAVIRTNDSTATIKNVVPGSGSFVINLAAAATAEVSIGWWILNF